MAKTVSETAPKLHFYKQEQCGSGEWLWLLTFSMQRICVIVGFLLILASQPAKLEGCLEMSLQINCSDVEQSGGC